MSFCASGNCCRQPETYGAGVYTSYCGYSYCVPGSDLGYYNSIDCTCQSEPTCRGYYGPVGKCTAVECPDGTSVCYDANFQQADPEDSDGPCKDNQSSAAIIIVIVLLLLLCAAAAVLGYAFKKKIWMFDPARKQQVAVAQQAGDEEAPIVVQPNVTATGQEAELQACKVPELRKKAAEAGCDDDAIEDARDANDPKAALIALIMSSKTS